MEFGLISRFQRKDETGDLLAQRKAWAEEIENAEREHARIFPLLWAAENQAAQALEQARQEAAEMIRKATVAYEKAQRDRWRAEERRDAIVDPCRSRLYQTRSPKICGFSDKLERTRQELRPQHEMIRNSNGHDVIVRSTAPSLKLAVDRINRIVAHELRAVELEPLSDTELEAKLTQLEASIPTVEMVKI